MKDRKVNYRKPTNNWRIGKNYKNTIIPYIQSQLLLARKGWIKFGESLIWLF